MVVRIGVGISVKMAGVVFFRGGGTAAPRTVAVEKILRKEIFLALPGGSQWINVAEGQIGEGHALVNKEENEELGHCVLGKCSA